MSFKDLKKSRKSQFEKLAKYAEDSSSGKTERTRDERYWNLNVDRAQNGSAIIRFLPAPEGEDVPFVRYWDHAFKGPGGWYIENSLTTLGQEDPASELNRDTWAQGTDDAKAVVRGTSGAPGRKRRLHFIANIYVIKDPANPENEGKVFLWDFGKKLYDKINAVMHPEFEDEQPLNPFDLWEGANFRLRAREVDGYRNYDKSDFDKPSPLFDTDAELEAVYNNEYSLQAEIAPNKFKSYDELAERLNRVLGKAKGKVAAEDDEDDEEPAARAWTPPVKEGKAASQRVAKPAPGDDDDDEDGSLDFFRKLADS